MNHTMGLTPPPLSPPLSSSAPLYPLSPSLSSHAPPPDSRSRLSAPYPSSRPPSPSAHLSSVVDVRHAYPSHPPLPDLSTHSPQLGPQLDTHPHLLPSMMGEEEEEQQFQQQQQEGGTGTHTHTHAHPHAPLSPSLLPPSSPRSLRDAPLSVLSSSLSHSHVSFGHGPDYDDDGHAPLPPPPYLQDLHQSQHFQQQQQTFFQQQNRHTQQQTNMHDNLHTQGGHKRKETHRVSPQNSRQGERGGSQHGTAWAGEGPSLLTCLPLSCLVLCTAFCLCPVSVAQAAAAQPE
jgi:hypothetical protein